MQTENSRGQGPKVLGTTLQSHQFPFTVDHFVTAPRAASRACREVERAGTHFVLGQGFQVLQDLSHHCLTQLAVLSQELGVSPVQAVIGVNWVNKQEQHVTWNWQMTGRAVGFYGPR